MADTPESNGTPPAQPREQPNAGAAAPKPKGTPYLIGGAILHFVDDIGDVWNTVKKKLAEGAALGDVFKNMWMRVSTHLAFHGQQIHDLEVHLAKLSPEFRKHLKKRNADVVPRTPTTDKD